MVTKELIRTKVGSDPRWAERAILALYRYQTSEEQVIQETRDRNNVGFNGVDAYILSSFAEQIARGKTLSQKQLAIAFKKLPKYAGQLFTIATEQEQQPEPKPVVQNYDISDIVIRTQGGDFGAEASMVEHRFGGIPVKMTVDGKVYNSVSTGYNGDEITIYVYEASDHTRLIVWND